GPAHVRLAQQVQLCGILSRLRRPAEQETEAVLEPVAVRNRAHDRAAGNEYAMCLGKQPLGEAQVLEQLARDDDVERLWGKRQRLLQVGPDRLDAELRRLGESVTIDVDADHRISPRVAARERAVATPEIEDVLARPAYPRLKGRGPLGLAEDEVPRSELRVVTPIDVLDVLERGHVKRPGRRESRSNKSNIYA